MQIKEVRSPEEKALYNTLAKEYGNVFNTLEWLKIFENKIRLFGIYEDDGKLIGGFFLYQDQKFGLKIYRDPPSAPCIGPFFRIEAKNPSSIASKQKEIMKLMVDTINKMRYSIVSISLNREAIDTQPFIWRKFKVTPRYTYILDLNKSVEDIYKAMSVERRNDVSKAIKDGLIVKQTNDFKIVKSLVLKTFSRQEMTINKYYLDKVLFEFIKKDNSFTFMTFENNKPSAVAVCIYDKNTAYYLFGGYDYGLKHHGSGTSALWEAIKYAKSLNLKYFDFDGSMVPQIERYFRGFGGKLTPYYRINKAWLPLEIILKFFKRELF